MTPVRVLLIEDTLEDARLIQEALVAEQGSAVAFQLTHAIALEPGLRHLANNETDVVLLDLNLPDSVGLGSVVRVRERSPGVPILVLTASDDTAIAVEAVKRGAEDYLVKGHVQVYPNLLSRAIRYALERQRVEGERERLQGQLLQSQKMEIIGRFAGGIAHDFNNFLQAILGFAWLIRARFQKSPELMADLQEIVHATESASEMVQQLLAFSRRKPLQPEVFDMNAAVQSMARLLQQFVGDSIHVEVALAAQPLAVRMDPTGLEQILMNLCANARDSMSHGGTLTISTRRVSADAGFLRVHPGATAATYAALSIRDTGTGMDPAVAAHIFEPFFTTKPTGQGTGLGLAVVYGLVQQHDGLIHIDTAPGEGTTFHLFFPSRELQPAGNALAASAESDGLPVAPAAGAPGRGIKRRIRSVDADPAIRRLCERILATAYEVMTVPSARAARKESAAAEPSDFSLLVIDIDGLRGAPGRTPEELMGSLEEAVRKSVARDDHVIPFGPLALAVLAVADAAGAEAMRKRLAERCAEWGAASVGAGASAGYGIGTATFLQDGDTATTLVQRAKARAAEDRKHRQGTGAGAALL